MKLLFSILTERINNVCVYKPKGLPPSDVYLLSYFDVT